MKIIIKAHALKHGLSENEIRYAWEMIFKSTLRDNGADPARWIAVGWLPDGRQAQLIAIKDRDGNWEIFHAMTPPTKKVMKELGL